MSASRVSAVVPPRAVEGGCISVVGEGLVLDRQQIPTVRVRDRAALVTLAAPDRLSVVVPSDVGGPGPVPVWVQGVEGEAVSLDVAAPIATGLHQVDSPAVGSDGSVYLTYSGARGQKVPVSVFRVVPGGVREVFASGIVNATSMAIGPDGQLYVSSRFEGSVYRVSMDGNVEVFASELGVACGLAFADDGTLFVGDRQGTLFAVDARGRATPMASLPPSVAAFHLARGADALYVTAPTLSSRDAVYRVAFDGRVDIVDRSFGRPQGLACGPDGNLYVVEALAGASGLYRLGAGRAPELVVAGQSLIGVAFAPGGHLVVCSTDTAYRLPFSP